MRINLLDCFEKTVNENKEKTAIIHNEEAITYEQLRRMAFLVAGKIDSNISNHPIAVFLAKSIPLVYADLGIAYSGNPFMNLDIKTPIERINNILKLIRPAMIITDEKHKDLFPNNNVMIIDNVDGMRNICFDIENESELLNRRSVLIDTDPFCIINTSGSTGTPKGVILNHRSFFDFLDWAADEFGFDGSEIMGSLSPAVFDIYDFELCMMMIHGSTMVVLDAGLAAWPARLLEAMARTKVNFIFWVPSIMVNIANMQLIDKIPLKDLKTVWFAGEVFPTKQFLYWYDVLPEVRFANLYGPIEITLDCTFYDVKERPDESKPLPIGVPCRNTDILILNENDRICQTGEEGELCVRGTSLAMGYYNNPEKTKVAFVQNPINNSYPELIYRTGDIVCLDSDGLIQFRGRKDSLIKHMGYRIELGEIEHVIVNELKMVEYCCAVYQSAAKKIVLYYEKDEEISDSEFKKVLASVFPNYMIPGKYIRMDLLPRNTNGKIDRLALKQDANNESDQ